MNMKMMIAVSAIALLGWSAPSQAQTVERPGTAAYPGLSIQNGVSNNRGTATLPGASGSPYRPLEPEVQRPIARYPTQRQPDVLYDSPGASGTVTPGTRPGVTNQMSAVEARAMRQQQLDQEREARIQELNDMRDQVRLQRQQYEENSRAASMTSGQETPLNERVTMDGADMSLLAAYKQRRQQEIENKQRRYQEYKSRTAGSQ